MRLHIGPGVGTSRREIISFGACHWHGFNKQIFGADEQVLGRDLSD